MGKNKIRIISVYPNFANRGGAQDVALQLAEHLNEEKSIVLTETPSANIVLEYKTRAQFDLFCKQTVLKLADGNTLFLSHHRKSTSLLLLYRFFSRNKFPIIHVAHNTFNNLKYFSFFPDTIVAVSNGVKQNLMDYFHVHNERIKVIFNGLKDNRNNQNKKQEQHEIHILLPGRICEIKQQIEIIKNTRGKLASHIHFYFAGLGEDAELLKKEIENDTQYHYVGFLNMYENLNKYDYVCLFSKKEGLPLSLIEGCMFGKPLITNDIPAVLDVNEAGKTGFVYSDLKTLSEGLNLLPMAYSEDYKRLSYNARLKYEKYFTEDKMLTQYRQIIEDEMKLYR